MKDEIGNSWLANMDEKTPRLPSDYWDNIVHRISTTTTIEELQNIREMLYTSREINRRIKKNRDMLNTLYQKITDRAYQLINEGVQPF